MRNVAIVGLLLVACDPSSEPSQASQDAHSEAIAAVGSPGSRSGSDAGPVAPGVPDGGAGGADARPDWLVIVQPDARPNCATRTCGGDCLSGSGCRSDACYLSDKAEWTTCLAACDRAHKPDAPERLKCYDDVCGEASYQRRLACCVEYLDRNRADQCLMCNPASGGIQAGCRTEPAQYMATTRPWVDYRTK